jgi:hypothetical protein
MGDARIAAVNGTYTNLLRATGKVLRLAACLSVLLNLNVLTGGMLSAQTAPASMAVINKGMKVQVGSWMEIADNSTLVLDVFTVECWVKAQTRFVIASRDWPGNHLPDWSVVYEASRRRIEFMTGMNSMPDEYFWTPDNSFPPNVWNHLALVVNGPAGTAEVYINGAIRGSFSFAGRNFTVNTGLAWGGYYSNAGGATGGGTLDEARYWKGERTQSEILALMNINVPDPSALPNLHGWWRFCDNYDDSSIYGNHGTPRGAPPIVVIPDLPVGIFCEAELTVVGQGGALCPGDTLQLTSVAAGPNGPFSFSWSPAATLKFADTQNPLAFPTTTTSYIVQVTDQLNNVATDTVTVYVYPELRIDAGEDIELCGVSPVQLYCGVLNGLPPFRFRWESDPTLSALDVANPVATPLGPGVYTYVVHVTDANGCEAVDSVRLIIREEVQVDAGPDIRLCGREAVPLSVDISSGAMPFAYRWWPDSSLSNDTARAPVANPFQTTTYHVQVMSADSCMGEDSMTVFVYPEVIAALEKDTVLCAPGYVDLSLIVAQARTPLQIEWTPAGMLDLSDPTRPRTFVSATTVFRVLLTDANGCTFEDSVTVTVKPGVDLRLDGDTLLCEAAYVPLRLQMLSGRAPFTVLWQQADSMSIIDQNHVNVFVWRTATYAVTVTDADGCSETASITVTVVPELEILLDSLRTICEGDDVLLDPVLRGGRGPFTARWEPAWRVLDPDALQTRGRCDSVASFIIRVTDIAGCEAVDTMHVRTVPAPKVDAGADRRICAGDTVVLRGDAQGGSGPYTWKWTPVESVLGSTTDSTVIVAPQTTTRFVLTVRAANGCVARDTVEVVVESVAQVRIEPSGFVRICEGDSVTLQASPGLARYEWIWEDTTVVGTTSAVTVRKPGHYSLRVWTAFGCTGLIGPVNVIISPPPEPVIVADKAIPLCEGDSVTLSTGNSYARYRWLDDSGRVVSTEKTLTVRTPGSYRVVVENAVGCEGSALPLDVRFLHVEAPVITGPIVICQGDTAEYSVVLQPGDSLEWSVSGGNIIWTSVPPGTVRIAWSGPPPAVVRVRLFRQAVSGGPWCEASAERPVTLEEMPTSVITARGPAVICEGDSVVLQTNPGLTRYEWITPDGSVVGTDSLVVGKAGNYRVKVTNAAGCSAISESFTVVVAPYPDVQILGPRVVCAGSEVRYSALNAAAASCRWEVSGGTMLGGAGSDSIQVRWPASGSGRVVLRMDNGLCPAQDTIHVSIADSLKPEILPSGYIEICAGDSVTLHAGSGFAFYEWTTPDGTAHTPGIVARRSGVYRVRVQDADGCSGSSDPVTVSVRTPIPPVITGPGDICLGDTALLVASPSYLTYRWSTGASGPELAVTASGSYHVTAVDSFGCEVTSESVTVIVHAPPDKPVIRRSGDTLYTDVATHYTWSRDGEEIADSDSPRQAILGSGNYRVAIVDGYGCRSISDPFPVDEQRAQTVVALPHLTADPGDVVSIPLLLQSESGLAASGAQTFSVRIGFDATVLVPVQGTPEGSFTDGRRMLHFDHVPWLQQAPLQRMLFLVTLGTVDHTPLTIDLFDWNGAPVDVTTVDGSLTINICREGGDRLFDGGRRFLLMQNAPNPVRESTEITYAVITRGPVVLRLSDLYGRTIRTMYDGVAEPGTYTVSVDLSDLSSGMYLYTLHTTVGVLQKQLLVAH